MNSMRIGVIFFCFLGFRIICQAQSPSDSIQYTRNIWGTKFYQNNYRINFNQLSGLVGGNEDAARLMRQAYSNKTGSTIVSGIGGFLLGWQLGAWMVGGEPNWAIAAIGEGLILVSIPFSAKANKLAIQATEIYNKNMTANHQDTDLQLGVLPGGIGLKIFF